jgi:hypothetical protein
MSIKDIDEIVFWIFLSEEIHEKLTTPYKAVFKVDLNI